jgi:predicted dehydrogenase
VERSLKSKSIMKPLRIAVVGCGHICDQYALHIQNYPDLLEIAGASDVEFTRAERFVEKYGGKAYADFDEVLADDSVDLMLNLTIHHAHFDLNKRALEAGKHVYSEKPVALTHEQAQGLIEVAVKNNRRLAAAPSTFLGEGIQTSFKFLAEEKLGPLRMVYAEVNWGQIERWISNPAPYYTVGPLLDVGVYAITAMVYLLGPAKKVWGYSTILKDRRFDAKGNEFPVTAPDFTVGMIEFASGVKARITTNYYIPTKGMNFLKGLQFHGDEGSFTVGCYHNLNPQCTWNPYNQQGIPIPLLRPRKISMDRAIGIADLAESLQQNRPHLASAEQAAHVIEIMEGLQKSSDTSSTIEIRSNPPPASLMKWAQAASIQIPNLPASS